MTLVERTNKSVHVTPVGEEVVARARQILFDVEAIASVGRRGRRTAVRPPSVSA